MACHQQRLFVTFMVRTKLWLSPDQSSTTMVQYRADVEPQVWLHTSRGWVPVDASAMEDAFTSCEQLADAWQLEEADDQTTAFFAGLDSDETSNVYNECSVPLVSS